MGIELGSYTYQNDNREFAEIDTIQIGDTIHSRIIKLDTAYAFDLGDKRAYAARGCSSDSVAYALYPYFGGDEPAHDTVRIYIRFD